jgi:hypothetical protein
MFVDFSAGVMSITGAVIIGGDGLGIGMVLGRGGKLGCLQAAVLSLPAFCKNTSPLRHLLSGTHPNIPLSQSCKTGASIGRQR